MSIEQPLENHPLATIDKIVHSPARLMLLAYLYVVESAEYIFLVNMTGLTWGNLATHIGKLETAGYVEVEKEIRGKKVHSMVHLTNQGRKAFKTYKTTMQSVLNDLPD